MNLEGYVGFANLPNQVYRKSVKRGFEFTLMVVGELFSYDLGKLANSSACHAEVDVRSSVHFFHF